MRLKLQILNVFPFFEEQNFNFSTINTSEHRKTKMIRDIHMEILWFKVNLLTGLVIHFHCKRLFAIRDAFWMTLLFGFRDFAIREPEVFFSYSLLQRDLPGKEKLLENK